MPLPWRGNAAIPTTIRVGPVDQRKHRRLIQVAHRRAAAGVSGRIGRENTRRARATAGGLAARLSGVKNRPITGSSMKAIPLQDRAATPVHHGQVRKPRRGVGQHQRRQPIRRVRADPLPIMPPRDKPHRANRSTPSASAKARMSRANVDGVVARRDRSSAVPADVIPQDAKVVLQAGRLRIPLRVVAAERVGKDQHRTAVDTVDPIILAQSASFH